MAFNPSQQQWGNEVGNPNRPTIIAPTGGQNSPSGTYASQLGRSCGYARGVLRFECGRSDITVPANPGPASYSAQVGAAISDLKAFFGYPRSTTLDALAYELLDVCVIF